MAVIGVAVVGGVVVVLVCGLVLGLVIVIIAVIVLVVGDCFVFVGDVVLVV